MTDHIYPLEIIQVPVPNKHIWNEDENEVLLILNLEKNLTKPVNRTRDPWV